MQNTNFSQYLRFSRAGQTGYRLATYFSAARGRSATLEIHDFRVIDSWTCRRAKYSFCVAFAKVYTFFCSIEIMHSALSTEPYKTKPKLIIWGQNLENRTFDSKSTFPTKSVKFSIFYDFYAPWRKVASSTMNFRCFGTSFQENPLAVEFFAKIHWLSSFFC